MFFFVLFNKLVENCVVTYGALAMSIILDNYPRSLMITGCADNAGKCWIIIHDFPDSERTMNLRNETLVAE